MTLLGQAAILFVIGATLGSVCDGFHTHAGVTQYAHPWILKMAWWVPLLFGVATVAIGVSRSLADRFFRQKSPAKPWAVVGVGMVCLIALYFASAVLPLSNVGIVAVLAPASLLLWWMFDCSGLGLAIAVATALAGTTVEITLVHQGLFFYTRPDLFGVASWLPWLYLAASVAVGNLGRTLGVNPWADYPA